MNDIRYEDLPIVWQREAEPDWYEVEEAVIEQIAKEVEACQLID